LGVVEAGDHDAPAEVHSLGCFAREREHLGVGADGEDAIARDRDRLCPRLGVIRGEDLAAVQDQRRGGRGSPPRG
jgi:hypothetical protein